MPRLPRNRQSTTILPPSPHSSAPRPHRFCRAPAQCRPRRLAQLLQQPGPPAPKTRPKPPRPAHKGPRKPLFPERRLSQKSVLPIPSPFQSPLSFCSSIASILPPRMPAPLSLASLADRRRRSAQAALQIQFPPLPSSRTEALLHPLRHIAQAAPIPWPYPYTLPAP